MNYKISIMALNVLKSLEHLGQPITARSILRELNQSHAEKRDVDYVRGHLYKLVRSGFLVKKRHGGSAGDVWTMTDAGRDILVEVKENDEIIDRRWEGRPTHRMPRIRKSINTVTRKCLACQKIFNPKHKSNYLCPPCLISVNNSSTGWE